MRPFSIGFDAAFAAVLLVALRLPEERGVGSGPGGHLPAAGEPVAVVSGEVLLGFHSWGAGQFPFVIVQREQGLSAELLTHLQGAFVGWEEWGMARGGWAGDATLLKADWHTIRSLPWYAPVFVPRPDKASDMVQRAPARLFAFAEAFRDANAEAFNGIAQDLESLALSAENGSCKEGWTRSPRASWLLRVFAGLIRTRRHFGVIELQLYAGSMVYEGGTHNDGTTSILHLSLTLGGHRTVRAKVESNVTAPVWQESVAGPGSVYLASPSFYQHQVSYHAASPAAPLIALHFRLAFPPEVAQQLNQRWDAPVVEIARVVARRLRASETTLQIPSLEAVRASEAAMP